MIGKAKLFFVILLLAAIFPISASAFRIDVLNDVPKSGDFVLNQSKVEAVMNPGDNLVQSLIITNRSGSNLVFTVSTEDFSGSTSTDKTIDLLGISQGPYSLKDYLKPEITTFTLNHGEQMTLPVKIELPKDIQPGGLYGAVIISTNSADNKDGSQTNVRMSARLASLFFVRVNGDINAKGGLTEFKSDRRLYFAGPVKFNLTFKNTGDIYLNPYGGLSITDVWGRQVYLKTVLPYFVMPGAERKQSDTFDKKPLIGMFKATLQLNRGYGNYMDQRSIYFFVFPVQYLIAGIIILLALIWLIVRVIISYRKK